MSVERLREALCCGKAGCPCRKGQLVHCPAHHDEHPSLSVGKQGGKPLVKCHAGCPQDAVIEAVKAKGLWPTYAKGQRAASKESQYEVLDVDGKLHAVHVRVDRPGNPKHIWWELPDGTKGLNGRSVEDLPLYGSERLKALADGATVLVCEGEKAAKALADVGIIAVGTVTGAAGTPSLPSLRVLLRFAVVLWPDNDDAGRDHMQRIGARLAGMGVQAKVLTWSEAPPKGDAADAVAAGVDVSNLINKAVPLDLPMVRLSELSDQLVLFIRRFLVLSKHQAHTLALWVLHTWALDAAEFTPYLHINSPVKRSGKTLLLELLALVVAKPWPTARVSAAALVRKVASQCPTLLLDESDAAFKAGDEYSETLRSILNAGFKRSGRVTISIKGSGDGWEAAEFPVFCPKAIAGIGRLPDTVEDRSIPITMQRRAPNEKVERFRTRRVEKEVEPLRGTLRLLADNAIPRLMDAEPALPEELDDRAADVWEPLLAIADLAGGSWPQRARDAATALSGNGRDNSSLGERLLADTWQVFESKQAESIFSADLVAALVAMEEAPWGNLRDKPMDVRALASLLRLFGVKPKSVRIGEATAKGYSRSDFSDAWLRYLSFEGSRTSQRHNADCTAQTDRNDPSQNAGRDGSNGTRPGGEFHDVTDVTDKGVREEGQPASRSAWREV